MNIEETKKAIEVMQAFVDGKAVQVDYNSDFSRNEDWTGTDWPIWDWMKFKYRIKPVEPKEIWVNECPGYCSPAYETKAAALEDVSSFGYDRLAVHYREVIEE